MDKPIIEVKGLSKRYTISHEQGIGRYNTFRDTVMDAAKAPFRRMAGGPPSTTEETFWALKDISFKVNEGEVIGIIGRNGAGKTTLLKILSKITPPTEGKAILRGRVSSLLEVGTGFHPELTGRENIYLNGAILGMTRGEIDEKFDDIVKFSEIEQFLDTPVKRYSSGMYVRLAFSVAAHLEPEILLVDEVLAVGDVQFQKKCLGKMKDVATIGRTVLFVSHNMGAIKTLCSRAILIDKGKIDTIGDAEEVANHYLDVKTDLTASSKFDVNLNDSNPLGFRSVSLRDPETGVILDRIPFQKPFDIEFEIISRRKLNPVIGVAIVNNEGQIITTNHNSERYIDKNVNASNDETQGVKRGLNVYRCHVQPNFFRPGIYTLTCSLFDRRLNMNYDHNERALLFEISDTSADDYFDKRQQGVVITREFKWEKIPNIEYKQ